MVRSEISKSKVSEQTYIKLLLTKFESYLQPNL